MSCRGCIYKARPGVGYICDYAVVTGHSRGCPIEGCTVKETSGQVRRKISTRLHLPGSPPPLTQSARAAHLKFDEGRALELYNQGLTDRQIADELGNVVTKHGIRAWRGRKGLKRDGSGKPIPKEAVIT